MAETRLGVLSYNVKMLPGPFGGGAEDLGRAQRIAHAIATTRPAWDVVCLQEVFDEDARDLFARALADTYPYRITRAGGGDVFQEDSGLFFASRHPILGHFFRPFSDASGTDGLANKGIFGARLDIARVNALVFNTHLQSSISAHRVRKRQLDEAHAFIRSAMTRSGSSFGPPLAIACGDFNVVGEHGAGIPTDEYTSMLSCLGAPRDLYRELHPRATMPGYTWDGSTNRMIPRRDRDRHRLDYVFAWDRFPERHDDHDAPPEVRPLDLETISVERFETADPMRCLSDHFAVSVDVRFDV
jgi:endonuclease/exonuclease/phosphatase family metal-dependent hydrolase